MFPDKIKADPVAVSLNHLHEKTEWEWGEKEADLAFTVSRKLGPTGEWVLAVHWAR